MRDPANDRKRGGAASLAMLAALLCPSASEAVAPRRLVEVADISGPVVSPDGRQVAFRVERASIERNTHDSVWYVQDMDGRLPPRAVADGGVPLHDAAGVRVPAVARWSPDGRWIFYRALFDGRIDVWRAAADGSRAEAVTSDQANVRDFELGADGTTLRYSVGATRDAIVQAEQDEYDRGVQASPRMPVALGVFRSAYVAGRLATQRFTGEGFIRDGLLSETPDRWKEVDLASGESRDVAGPAASPSPAEREPRELPKAVRDSSAPVTSEQSRPGHEEVIFTTSARESGWAQAIFRWKVDTGEVLPVVRARGLVNGGRKLASTCGISADALVCVAAEADRPPRLERIDIDTGDRRIMFDPNDALASDLAASVASRFLRWKGADGLEFTGHLFLGTAGAATGRPLLVTYYSCPGFLRGGTGDEWPLASLAVAGIATLCINSQPYHSDPLVRYGQGLEAVRSAVELLAAEGVIDPDHVGMGGLSFGAEVSLWVATESDLLAAVSVTSPAVTPHYYLVASLQGDRFLAGLRDAWGLGAPEETPERWKRLSLAFNHHRIRVPVLFQMPEEEYLYGLDYIIPMLGENRADLYIFPHETHQKFQPRHKLAACERNLDWFRFWLQEHEDDDPAKRSQYQHWRTMREGLSTSSGKVGVRSLPPDSSMD